MGSRALVDRDRARYVGDSTLGEDASRIRNGSGPQVMGALARCGDWLFVSHTSDELRRVASQQRFSSPRALHEAVFLATVSCPGARVSPGLFAGRDLL